MWRVLDANVRYFSEPSMNLKGADSAPLAVRIRVKQLVRICMRRTNLKRTIIIALAIGTFLVIINQLGPVLNGPRPPRFWLQISLDYVVPFMSSNLGVLSDSRNGQR